MKGIRRFFVNLKLRNKLLLAFSVFIILPTVTLTLVSTYLTKYIIEKNAMFSATQSFNQVSDFVSYRIDNVIRATNLIANDQLVHTVAERDPSGYPLEEQFENLQKLRLFLISHEKEDDIFSIRLFLNDQMVHSNEDGDVLGLEAAEQFPWYQCLNSSQVMLFPPVDTHNNDSQTTLSAVRMISSFDNSQDVKGYVMVEFPEQIFRDMISRANSTGGSLTYICNDQYQLVSTTNEEKQKNFALNAQQMDLALTSSDWVYLQLGNEKVFAKVKAIPSTTWFLVTIVPESGIFRDTHLIQSTMVLLMLFLIGIAYLGAVFVTLSLTKRIDLLASKMDAAQQGDLSKAIVHSNAKDEIGMLIQNFNYMIDRIQTLMAEEKVASQRLRSAELMALQSQINPHFLYNTLDMINWMSYEEDKGKEIRTTLRSLRFYKLSLNKGRAVVSLRDELKHISCYMQIQNMRLQNAVDLDIRVPDHLQQCGILKITLQPIVENAVLHGIMEKKDAHGVVNIDAKLSGEDLLITVGDDGVGIPPAILETLLSEDDISKTHGYGLANVNERIMLYFGEKYGLSIQSEVGKGSLVTIRIPFRKLLEEP